jgi:hypothetical protein
VAPLVAVYSKYSKVTDFSGFVTGGRHGCVMALGFATILAPERISLTIAMDFDKLSAGEENMQSLERVLLQDLSLSLQVPRHRLLVSRIRPAPTPNPRQRDLAGESTRCVVVELCVEAGAFMEPTAQQIAEVCPVCTDYSACTEEAHCFTRAHAHGGWARQHPLTLDACQVATCLMRVTDPKPLNP